MMTLFTNNHRTRRAGLTLLELLLATAGTALVGAAIVMMLSAVTTGTRESSDLRLAVVKQKMVTGRITTELRSAIMVLVARDDLLILWSADTNSSGTPNLGELRRIERDSATGQLRCYAAPDTLVEASNAEYELTADFDAITAPLRGTDNFPMQLWATAITQWTVSANHANVQEAKLISCRFEIDLGHAKESMIAVTALHGTGLTSFNTGG